MSIEIIGMVGTKEVSESRGSFDGPQIDAGYLARFAQAHEAAGFDRVLIGYGATGPDGFAVAAHVLYATSTLKVLIAHRPGFVAPTLVARKLATLDQLTGGGRVAIHHITGGDELDQKRDGDFAGHDRRYARTAEFMSLLRRELTSAEPFDHDGSSTRCEGRTARSGRRRASGSRSTSVARRPLLSRRAPSTRTSTCSGASR
jgi:alkanesulfonate monooxygenase